VSVIVSAPGMAFIVYGLPVPQGSKRIFRGNVVDMQSERLRTWRQDVAGAAKEAMVGTSPYAEPVDVRLTFWLPRPQAHFGTGRNSDKLKPSAPLAPAKMPDLDKLCRAVLDAMTHIVWNDDAQVVGLTAAKLYADGDFSPGVSCSVLELRG
jgi:Holliday junction resolvase RusA-like endonuclease